MVGIKIKLIFYIGVGIIWFLRRPTTNTYQSDLYEWPFQMHATVPISHLKAFISNIFKMKDQTFEFHIEKNLIDCISKLNIWFDDRSIIIKNEHKRKQNIRTLKCYPFDIVFASDSILDFMWCENTKNVVLYHERIEIIIKSTVQTGWPPTQIRNHKYSEINHKNIHVHIHHWLDHIYFVIIQHVTWKRKNRTFSIGNQINLYWHIETLDFLFISKCKTKALKLSIQSIPFIES